jgi:hypothetical protein
MATQRPPNDPYDPYRSGLSDDIGRRSRFETDMQPDPDLAEGPASSAKIALFALGIALVLGAVFYSLNNTSVHEAQTAPPKSVAQSQPAAPQPPSGMRDVTPRANTSPGTTTGAAPSSPTPPQSAPQGQEVDRAK